MAQLQIVKPDEGRQIPLDGDKFVMGRNPDCAVVIPVTSVSREHAQIVRVNGKFFIEDKQSRNGTFVNSQAITGRTPLKNNDKIRICDFHAVFLENGEADEEEPGNTTVEATLAQSSHMILDTQPAERLRGLLEISASLNKTLQLDLLFPKIGDSLFQLFRQADRCFLILAEDDGKKLLPRLVKTRLPDDETKARFSKTIVRRCLESGQAILSAGGPDERPCSARASSISASGRSCAFRCAPPTARPSASSSSTPSTAARNSPRKTSNCSGASPTRPPSPWRTPGCTRRRSTRKRCGATWSWRIRCR